jgi:xylulokinase
MWFRDAFCQEEARQAKAQGLSTYQLLSQMVDSVEPGSDRLIFAPWLSGERAPVLDHYARGAWVGLNLGHTKAHLARSIMEGVAFHLRWICEAMEHTGLQIGRIHAIGGGSTSPTWTQIISDITGRTLHVVDNAQEAGAMGAALTVAVGLGVYPSVDSIDELIGIRRVVEPGTSHTRRYQGLYEEYRALYDGLSPTFRRMHEVE